MAKEALLNFTEQFVDSDIDGASSAVKHHCYFPLPQLHSHRLFSIFPALDGGSLWFQTQE